MPSYDFAIIIAAGKMSHEEILDATDALGEAGCTDAFMAIPFHGASALCPSCRRSRRC